MKKQNRLTQFLHIKITYNLIRSLEVFGLKLVVLGMGEEWQGGDMNGPAGGWKVNLLKQGWKIMSRSHCQELCQQASWPLIGCTRVNNQSEARTASLHNS